MAPKKVKGRGGWTKTQSISRIYDKNSLEHGEKQSSDSATPTPMAPSETPTAPQNSPTFIVASSTKRVHAPRDPTPVPTLPSQPQTAPPVSHASTTITTTNVTPRMTRVCTPTPTPPEIRDSSLIEQDCTEPTRKNKRGITRGLDLSKRNRSGDRIDINMSKDVMRAVGKDCQYYITDTGCIVRRYAPLQVNGWKEIPRIEVERLILRVREKFKLSNEPHVNEAIEEDMKRRYIRWRYTLHQKYLEILKTGKDARANPPDTVDAKDWEYLIKLWQDDKWKQKSKRNKENNEKIQFHHCAGTKAFSRIRWENQNPETGVLPSRIDMFKLTRYDEEHDKWVDDDAKNAYDEMNKLLTNPPKELKHLSEDEIYDLVLGESPSGYIRGLGAGPKPKHSSAGTARRCAQLEAATRRAEEAETRSAQLADELTTIKDELAEMQSKFNEKLLEIQAQLRDRG